MTHNAPDFPRIWNLVFLFTLSCSMVGICFAQDDVTDHSTIHPDTNSLAYLLPLFTIHGVPKNGNADNPLTILVNHGYVVGYSPKYNQPLWAAYQVSKPKKDVDYERFPFFVDDLRLPEANRIGKDTFGDGYDLGHMVPNAATNRQYGKLSQMESFLVSNISPQKANLNRGVWQKLEFNILNKYPLAGTAQSPKNHVWVIVGPVFSDHPSFLSRKNGLQVAIPESFFCILARPKRYPYESPGNSDYITFLFGQEQTLESTAGDNVP